MTDGVRVLIVAPAPLSDDWAGGISNFVRSFVAHMPADFEVSIAGVAGPTENGRGDNGRGAWHELELAGREVRFLPVARLASKGHGSLAPRAPVKARAMWGLLTARPNIPTRDAVIQVHAPAMDLPLLMRKAPIIRVVHNAPDNLAATDGSLWRHAGWALRRAEDISFQRAQRVFFVDRATYTHYAGAAEAPAHMAYLPNGVDTDEFRIMDTDERSVTRTTLSRSMNLPQDGPWLLFCGRLDRQKDPELLIATFAEARRLQRLENAQLIIVGSGALEDVTRQAAHSAGVGNAVHLVGTLDHDQLPLVMGASDVLLLTSAYEAAPFVVLEALACGLPVVSTAVGDVPTLVEHERTGWIATAHSAGELARGVAWAMAQPRDEIAPRAAESMRAYRIADVLAPFYDAHRELAEVASR